MTEFEHLSLWGFEDLLYRVKRLVYRHRDVVKLFSVPGLTMLRPPIGIHINGKKEKEIIIISIHFYRRTDVGRVR